LDIRGWHQGSENGEVLVHLFSSIAFNCNVGHSLILDLLLVLGALGAAAFAAGGGGGGFGGRRRRESGGERLIDGAGFRGGV